MAHVSLPMPGGNNDNVGHGTIYDSSAYAAPPSSSSSTTTLPTWSAPSSASQYRLPPSEILKGVANRFVHSTIYLYLYASMALASLFTVLLSLVNECPGDVFYVVEMVVNVVLVVEVGVRGVAFGRVSGREGGMRDGGRWGERMLTNSTYAALAPPHSNSGTQPSTSSTCSSSYSAPSP